MKKASEAKRIAKFVISNFYLVDIPKPLFKHKKGMSVLELSCYSSDLVKKKIKGNVIEKSCSPVIDI